jgi:DNA-binding transcriptional MerR regulator
MEKSLPDIPAKRYFTIGEVSELCGVKAYVLRYWEQEFVQLKPQKRRGNRRYYQHQEVLLVRRIRELLYDQGFTIAGARNKLSEASRPTFGRRAADQAAAAPLAASVDAVHSEAANEHILQSAALKATPARSTVRLPVPDEEKTPATPQELRRELNSIRALLSV